MSNWNFMLSGVEHEKSSIPLGLVKWIPQNRSPPNCFPASDAFCCLLRIYVAMYPRYDYLKTFIHILMFCQINRKVNILLKIIEEPRLYNVGIISSNIWILQNMAQIFLLSMPINQESLWLISMPNSTITVSKMHIPSKTHFQKAVDGAKKNQWSFEQNESDIKLNFVLTVQLTWEIFLQFHYSGKQNF